METLTRETKKLQEEAMPSAAPGKDGDRFWERPFNAKQSIERAREFEGRGTEFKVKCGLELWRAKLNLDRGCWLPYLKAAAISPTTSSRRMKVAKEFMRWANIADEKIEEHHIISAMEAVYSNNASCSILAEYAEYVAISFDEVRFYEESISSKHTIKNPPVATTIFGLIGKRIFRETKVIDHIIQTSYLSWMPEKQQEAKDTLDIFAQNFWGLKKYLDELDERR